jgi:hypothetical protein
LYVRFMETRKDDVCKCEVWDVNLFLLTTIIHLPEINIIKTAVHASIIIICFFSWLLFITASGFPSTFWKLGHVLGHTVIYWLRLYNYTYFCKEKILIWLWSSHIFWLLNPKKVCLLPKTNYCPNISSYTYKCKTIF